MENRKIYDAVLFFNELEMLELRLNILDPYVDYFIISECDYTFSGKPKPLYFEENKEKFSRFLHKIIHIKNYNTNDVVILDQKRDNDIEQEAYDKIVQYFKSNTFEWKNEEHWCRDFLHREYVKIGMSHCNNDDIIIFSDLDEIPNPEAIKDVKNWYKKGTMYHLRQNMYFYYFNVLKETNWFGPRIFDYEFIKNKSLNQDVRIVKTNDNSIYNGGWHFSFMGGLERVKTKIFSYGHQEFCNDHILKNLQNNMDNNNDPFFRGKMNVVKIDNTYPKYLLDNIDKYKEFIK